jgi:hypothetical protein
MIIVAGGDSFIWGAELADCGPGRYSKATWPALLSDKSNNQYICVAQPGAGNDSIARHVIKQCEEMSGQDIAVVVQWTFPWRFGFRYVDPIGWVNVDLQIVSEEFKNDWADMQINQFKKMGILDFTQKFFKLIGTTEYWPVYSTLKEILLLQGYLKTKGIPYLFASATNAVIDNYTITAPTDIYVKNLFDQVDQSNWYWFPRGTIEGDTLAPRGFYQWALENKYNVGPGMHPLEQAHSDAALLIKEKFNELVKKSI